MDEVKPDRELNLKGEFCPYTFIKSRLELDGMSPGQVLRVLVDNQVSCEDVPHAMKNEGQEVLRVEKVEEGTWEILVRKKH